MEIFLCYRQLFIKGDIFIGESEIFDAEVFLCYSQFFIKGDFVIDRVECTSLSTDCKMCTLLTSAHNDTDDADSYNRVIGKVLLKAFSCAKNTLCILHSELDYGDENVWAAMHSGYSFLFIIFPYIQAQVFQLF